MAFIIGNASAVQMFAPATLMLINHRKMFINMSRRTLLQVLTQSKQRMLVSLLKVQA
jgi:hypothetical protein